MPNVPTTAEALARLGQDRSTLCELFVDRAPKMRAARYVVEEGPLESSLRVDPQFHRLRSAAESPGDQAFFGSPRAATAPESTRLSPHQEAAVKHDLPDV